MSPRPAPPSLLTVRDSCLVCTDAQVAIKTISKKKFLVNERAVTTTRVSAVHRAPPLYHRSDRSLQRVAERDRYHEEALFARFKVSFCPNAFALPLARLTPLGHAVIRT